MFLNDNMSRSQLNISTRFWKKKWNYLRLFICLRTIKDSAASVIIFFSLYSVIHIFITELCTGGLKSQTLGLFIHKFSEQNNRCSVR